ncbi:MAG: ABC transporter permease [Ectothiorhodospiraceae bacterium]
MKRPSHALQLKLAPWLATVMLLLIWEGAIRALGVSQHVFPGFIDTITALGEHNQPILRHAWQTFWTTLVGFAIGVVVGLGLGVLIGASPMIYRAFYPLLIAFNAIPKVAFVPVLVVWFGIGTVPAIITAFLICFFPIVVNVATGLATLEPEMADVLRVLGARRIDVLWKVGLPRSMPYFFASLKVAITLAFVGTVVSETVASNQGIGYLMMSAGSQMRMPLVFAGLITISVMAMAMYQVFDRLERHITGWAHRDG